MKLTQEQKLLHAAIIFTVSALIWLCLTIWQMATPAVAQTFTSFLDFDKSVCFAAWTAIALILDLSPTKEVASGAETLPPALE